VFAPLETDSLWIVELQSEHDTTPTLMLAADTVVAPFVLRAIFI
jgi:hypothetical protein